MSDPAKKQVVKAKFMHAHPWVLALIFTALVAATTGYFSHFKTVRPILNDEALELIQGVGMPLDKFYFFTPDTSYPGGNADIIESFYPYIVRLTAGSFDESKPQQERLLTVRVLYCTFYVASCVLLAWTVCLLWGAGWGAGAGVALATSPFLLVINNILTRNGISILWSCLLVAGLVWWTRREVKTASAGNYAPAVFIAVVLILGCWTYTAFRLVAVAVYVALMVDWWCAEKSKAATLRVVASGIFFGGVLLVLMTWNSDSLSMILQRGGYAVKDSGGYLSRLALTLVTPFHHSSNRWVSFIVEDVHVLVGGAAVSKWLAGFFAIGWVTAWFRSCRLVRMAAVIWTTGMFLCAVAGPNFKYLLPFLPFALLLSLSGMKICIGGLIHRFGRGPLLRACAAVIFAATAWGGLQDFFTRFPADNQHEGNRITNALADVVIQKVKDGVPHVYVQPGRGVDIVYWRVMPLIKSGRVSAYSSIPGLKEGLADGEQIPAGAVLLIDYPIQNLKNSTGPGDIPADLQVINVRDLPGF